MEFIILLPHRPSETLSAYSSNGLRPRSFFRSERRFFLSSLLIFEEGVGRDLRRTLGAIKARSII